jgi:hypothetical protein
MKAQTPAEGIMRTNDFGRSKWYRVACSCGNEDDNIDFEVEADDTGVMVNTYNTQKTDYWTEAVERRYDIDNAWLQEFDWFWKDLVNSLATRLRLTWQIWRHGYIKYQGTMIMTEQQALNYAETLKSAILDVKMFREEEVWKRNHDKRMAKENKQA